MRRQTLGGSTFCRDSFRSILWVRVLPHGPGFPSSCRSFRVPVHAQGISRCAPTRGFHPVPPPSPLSVTGPGLSRRKSAPCSGALMGRLFWVLRLLFLFGQQIICRNLRINLLRRVRRTRVLRVTRLRAGGALSSSTSRTPRMRAGRDFSSTTTCWRPRRSW